MSIKKYLLISSINQLNSKLLTTITENEYEIVCVNKEIYDYLGTQKKHLRIKEIKQIEYFKPDYTFNIALEKARELVDNLHYSVFKDLKVGVGSLVEINEAFLISFLFSEIIYKYELLKAFVMSVNGQNIIILNKDQSEWELIYTLFSIDNACSMRTFERIFNRIIYGNTNIKNKLKRWYILKELKSIYFKFKFTKQFKSNKDTNTDIMLLNINKKTWDSMYPMYEEFKRRNISVKVLEWKNSNAKLMLKENEVNHINFWEYYEINKCFRRIKGLWNIQNNYSKIYNKLQLEINSSNIGGFEKGLLKYTCDYLIRNKMIENLFDYDLSLTMIEREKLEGIVVFNEREDSAKSMISAFKQKNVKSFAALRFLAQDHPENGPIFTDYLYVDGEVFKKNLLRRGAEDDKIIITGNSRFDELYKLYNDRTNFHNLKLKLKLNENKKVVTILSQKVYLGVRYTDMIEYLETCFKVLKDMDVQIIVKLHPGQDDNLLEKKIITKYGIQDDRYIFIKEEIPVNEVLVLSDIIVTMGSTLGIDAALLRIPLIELKTTQSLFKTMPNWAEENIAYIARNSKDFKYRLNDILLGSKIQENIYKRFEDRYAYSFDGKASYRIVNHILEKLNKYNINGNYPLNG